jgi:hypothetical protein
MEDSAAVHKFLDFFSGLKKFVQKQSWGHMATSKLPGHYIGLIIFKSAMILPSSIEFSRQHAWADYDIEDL